MRIAWFSHRYYPCLGGAEAYSRAMVRRFVASGHDVDVFTSDAQELWYFTDRRRQRVEAPAISVVDGARVHRIPVRHFPAQRYLGRLLSYVPHFGTRCRWESFMPYIPGIERVRGDYQAVLAVGFPFTVFSYGALKTARAAGAPLVLTPFLHLSTPGDAVSRHYTRPHQIRLLRKADLVVSPTQFECRVLAGWGLTEEQRLVLPMAIDQEGVTGGSREWLRRTFSIGDGELVIGQLGALDPNKGTNDLVRAVASLRERRGDSSIHLVLAGAPSPDFNRFLGECPETWRNDWLHVLGPLSTEHVADFYAGLDVFAMPSRTDSFGIVYLEAWANAKPVVAAAAGGVVEVVDHEQTGLLVRFGQHEELVECLRRLACDKSLRNRLGREGMRRVADASWDNRFKTLHERVEELAARHNRGGSSKLMRAAGLWRSARRNESLVAGSSVNGSSGR